MGHHSLLRSALIGISISSLTLVSATAATWDEKTYNPKPLKDDIILPMPCDGKMAFRMVVTETPKPLSEQDIVLGDDASEESFVSHSIPSYIAGSFKEKNQRYFLMAKYEITQSQYDAVMNNQCPSTPSALPAVNVSWFDAINFTRRYNEWIAKNAPKSLRSVDGENGFFRLPTDTEWEFATRGGNAVTPEQFREPIFPLNDKELYLFASFAGSTSSNNKLQPIGKPDFPNPLGLFDMLGNVRELILEPFRLNKLDRYHGQYGGVIVRGGSFRTPEELISSYLKDERPFFSDQGTPDKTNDIGFRIVMSSSVLTPTNFKKISQEWPQLLTPTTTKVEVQQTQVNTQLNQITNKVQDEKIKKELEDIKNNLIAANQQRDEQRDYAIKENLQLGAFLCRDIMLKEEFLDSTKIRLNANAEILKEQKDALKNYTPSKNTQPDCNAETKTMEEEYLCTLEQEKRIKDQLQNAQQALDTRLTFYSDTLVTAIENYDLNNIQQQVSNQRGNDIYRQTYWKHIQQYKKDGKNARKQYLSDCVAAASK